jgi:type IV secretory pathway protease TraF
VAPILQPEESEVVMRRLFSLGLVVFSVAAIASAAPSGKRQRIASSSSASSAPALYRIELADGRTIPSLGVPTSRGSVVVYRTPGGALTSVPN